MIKCKCGVELFENDVVDEEGITKKVPHIFDGSKWLKKDVFERTNAIYRCPKCFKTKKVKSKI